MVLVNLLKCIQKIQSNANIDKVKLTDEHIANEFLRMGN